MSRICYELRVMINKYFDEPIVENNQMLIKRMMKL